MSRKVRSRAPLRLGIAGGGTDLSPYCDQFTGYVLNATIDKYAYCTIEESDDDNVTFSAIDLNEQQILKCANYPHSIDELLPLHKAVYNRLINNYNGGNPVALKITTYSDAPRGSGLGGSSTLVVAIIKGFDEFFKIGLDDYQIAHLSYEIERIDCGFSGGRQDQYSATFGGFNFMEFSSDNRVLVNPLRIRNWIRCELENSLILHYTGKSRVSAKIIDDQVSSIQGKQGTSIEEMHKIKSSALHMKEALLRGDFPTFVEYLNLSWENKKKSSSAISNTDIDETIELAKNAGALGAKVSGAGGGGFMMFYVNPVNRYKVIEVLKSRGEWSSNCHFSSEGSQCWTISE